MTLEQMYLAKKAEDSDLDNKIDIFIAQSKYPQTDTYPQKFLYFLWNYTQKALYPNQQTA